MRVWTVALAGLMTVGPAGCRQAPPAEQSGSGAPGVPPDQEPPVALNGDSPIQRLVVDSIGRLLPESSRVAESSGYPALDSAALTGARRLRFAPARRHGLSIGTAFLQPVEFRHPQASGTVSKGEPDTTRPRPTPVRAPAAPPAPAPVPVRPARRDTTPARRDTFPPPLDTTRAVPDSAARPDSNAVPH